MKIDFMVCSNQLVHLEYLISICAIARNVKLKFSIAGILRPITPYYDKS